MKSLLTILLFALILSPIYPQDTINVPGDYTTIQAAIDAATNGDIVLVAEDTYYENINFNGKAITVASHFFVDGDKTHIDNTILDGNLIESTVFFLSGEDTTSVLLGFTITNGGGNLGGGIQCINSGPKILSNKIIDNIAGGNGSYRVTAGGGIYIFNDNALQNFVVIENNVITNNESVGALGSTGGGICIITTNGRIYNNVIVENEAIIGFNYSRGGAIAIKNCSPFIINNTIVFNRTIGYNVEGDAVSISDGQPILINNIIWGNIGAEQISENANVFYSDVEGGYSGIGNIDTYPEFVDTTNGDYHLAGNSPCIEVGIDSLEIDGVWYYCPITDLEGNPRPNPVGTMPDMGAYENGLLVEIEEDVDFNNPTIHSLAQNYPNPFNPNTKIKFSIPQLTKVVIKVFDILGNEIETLINEEKPAGTYDLTWYAESLPSGVYFYQLKAESFVETKKMLLLK